MARKPLTETECERARDEEVNKVGRKPLTETECEEVNSYGTIAGEELLKLKMFLGVVAHWRLCPFPSYRIKKNVVSPVMDYT